MRGLPRCVAILVVALVGRCAAAPRALIDAVQAAAVSGCQPFGNAALGKVGWHKIDGAQVKIKLSMPLEAASGVVKVLATDPQVRFAASNLVFNAGATELPLKDKAGGQRTLHSADVSMELETGAKDPAADKRKALGFGLVRRVFSSEDAKVKSGAALAYKQLEFGPNGCHVAGRGPNIAAVVTGFKRLAGELPVAGAGTGAGGPPKPSPVALGHIKIGKLVADSVDGVEGVAFEADGELRDLAPGALPRGFEVLEVAFGMPKVIADLHAPYANPALGEVLNTRTEPGAATIGFRTCPMVWPALVKKVEGDTRIDPASFGLALSQETRMSEWTDPQGHKRRYPLCRGLLMFSDRSYAKQASPPKRGDHARAIETLDKIFTMCGPEFIVMNLDAPPVAVGGAPPPPSPSPAPLRPLMRDLRIINGEVEMNTLFLTQPEIKPALEAMAKGGFTDVQIVKQQNEPYRDKHVEAVSLKARVASSGK